MAHRLVVLRHAKSSWEFDVPDVERPLSERGRHDAEAAGRLLLAEHLIPDRVLCSPAVRARQTWQHVQDAGVACADVAMPDVLYNGEAPEVVDALAVVPEQVRTLLVIGHLPTVEDVVDLVCGGPHSSDLWAALHSRFPTSGLAVVTLAGAWGEVLTGGGELTRFAVPRG